MSTDANPALSNLVDQGHQQLIETIAAAPLTRHQLAEGDALLHQGQPVTRLYWVEQGEFTLHYTAANGKRFCLGLWHARQRLFGEVETLTGKPCQFDVVAHQPVEVAALSPGAFQRAIEAQPLISLWLSRQLSDYYQGQMDKAINRALYPLAYNVALDLQQRQQQGEPALKSHQEAARFGCSERVYRRIGAHLVEQGIAEKHAGQLVVKNAARLAAFLTL